MILEIGRVVTDRYEITDKIGSGGMSIVYKALDRKLNRPVSLKVLREEYSVDEEFRKRFIREARSVASLNHQNIVNVYDVGQDGGINYIVMEYIAGMTLKELIKKRAPFSDKEVLGVAIQMAAALIHAHNSKIVHRDIKPQNVIVTGKGVIKVADFGIAKKTDSNSVTMGGSTTLGSVHYFSPEQARGLKADPKSDLYSLGIVMYEMLTGRLPFDADSAVSVALMQINEPMPDLLKYNIETNPKVKKIVMKLTEKNPEYRYQNAETLLRDLRALIANRNAMLSFEGEPRPEAEALEPAYDPEGYGLGTESLDLGLELDEEDDGYIRDKEETFYEDEVYDDYPEYDDYDEPEPEQPLRPEDVKYAKKTDARYGKKYVRKDTGNRDRNIIIGGIVTAAALIALFFLLVLPNLLKNLPNIGATPAPELVTLPEIISKDFVQLSRDLAALGISLYQEGEAFHPEILAGRIIEATYFEGDLVEEGTTIGVIVSKGINMVTVPQLTGNDLEEAVGIIAERGVDLRLREEYKSHPTYDAYIIFDQEPKPEARVPAGTEITLYISMGQENEQFEMPQLINRPLNEALAIMQELGLELGSEVDERFSSVYPAGVVMSQTIGAGKPAYAGNKVHIGVSKGPEITPTPEITPIPDSTVPPGMPGSNAESPEPTDNLFITPTPTEDLIITPAPTEPAVQTFPPAVMPTPTVNIIILPTPSPTPEPTPEQQPYQPPLVPEAVQKTFYIEDLGNFDYANVYVQTTRSTGGDVVIIEVYEGRLTLDDLPFPITVSGKGKVIYHVYLNGTRHTSITIDFDE
ncbi:MAG: Stk1 family PASTA domain-containing Ser/Thr kinase [Clostridiales bacterium]|jgi:serine/threonine-protein kinase|nr:Stk1 family PASTA domain-containing Ser/Thr kinase [Clostridiales bacterium]